MKNAPPKSLRFFISPKRAVSHSNSSSEGNNFLVQYLHVILRIDRRPSIISIYSGQVSAGGMGQSELETG